ncbi:MAG: PEP/pyruvate-binding domain-containing protein [Methanobacteriota archaeon]
MAQPGLNGNGDREPQPSAHHDLMKIRVSEILLVSSLYDAFILEEDGLLSEQISGEYQEFALSSPPRVSRVSAAKEALVEMGARRFDMVITMARLSDMSPTEFGERAKALQPGIRVIMLITEPGDLPHYHIPGKGGPIDKVFYWTGDAGLFLAITKYVEDMVNAEADVASGFVKVIIVVEDSPRFYSVFLPILYTEIMRQKNALLSEGLNEADKTLRRRSRPKILLAETFEEGKALLEKYRGNVLGLITDVDYPMEGRKTEGAGLFLIEISEPGLPTIVQSSKPENRAKAERLGAKFLDKNSDTLLEDLRTFFKERLGFGDFVFRMKDGTEVARAYDVRDLTEIAERVPAESLKMHGAANQFSNWLLARGEVTLAAKLRPKKVSDFASDEELRHFLVDALLEARREKLLGVVIDFSQQTFEFRETFTRFGGGSLGGKGRGLAFLASLIHKSGVRAARPDWRIRIPDTLVIGTEEFDRFVSTNGLGSLRKTRTKDPEIAAKFLAGAMSGELESALRTYAANVDCPVAVRSSSLLEDSQNQPFAGIYSTYLLPNNHPDREVRLAQLTSAVKLVYASAFFKAARAYIQTTIGTVEEERMGVVIQKLVGNSHGSRFYPLFSGVAQSYNFYPVPPMSKDDGIASVALGLGRTVVEGGKSLSFSPKHPAAIPAHSSPEEILANSQDKFFAIDMSRTEFDLTLGDDATLTRLDISDAEGDGVLDQLASTYDTADHRFRDGVGYDGPRAITFAGVLRHGHMPLGEILSELLDMSKDGMGRPVEMEFAVAEDPEGFLEFHLLQIRPMVSMKERSQVVIDASAEGDRVLVASNRALGNGVLDGISDVVYVPPSLFDRTKTKEIADEIGRLNESMAGKPYVLIGPGRWGTRDRFLGIPVEWDQISNARAIVEVGLEDFRIDPSHGSHFFHNITALGIPYFSVPYGSELSRVDWGWLEGQPGTKGRGFARHARLAGPLVVKVDGRSGTGVVLKPAGKSQGAAAH